MVKSEDQSLSLHMDRRRVRLRKIKAEADVEDADAMELEPDEVAGNSDEEDPATPEEESNPSSQVR